MKKLAILFFILPISAFSQIGIGIRPALTYSSTSTEGYSLSESWVAGFLSFEYALPLPATAIELNVGYKNTLEFEEEGNPDTISHSGINVSAIIKYYLPTESEQYRLFIGGGFETFSFTRKVNGVKKGEGMVNMNGVAPIGLHYKINPKLKLETLIDFDLSMKSKPEEEKSTSRINVGLSLGIKMFL